MRFRQIELKDKSLFQRYIHNTNCVYDSFAYWYGWSEGGRILVAEDEEALYIKTFYYDQEGVYLAPFLKDPNTSIYNSLRKVQEMSPQRSLLVCEAAKQKIEADCPGLMNFEDSRDLSEYIYKVADLINLEGHIYRSKRNRISSFVKKYPNLACIDYTPELFKVCMDLDKAWEVDKLPESEDDFAALAAREAERNALRRTLAQADFLNVKACLVEEEGKVIGLTVGEQTSPDMVMIHFEKCHPDYRDLYAWLNREFLRRYWSGAVYVNREEDLGEEGLRRAKLSYNPVVFSKHYWTNFI